VTIVNPTALSIINLFFWVLLLGAFVIEAWAFGDALRRPSTAFPAAGKQTKPIWLIILGVAFVIGIAGAVGYLSLISIFPIIAFVAAAIYLVDVRPKINSLKSSGTRQGPYGPW
jgi:predicted membrane metal-binding protein